jgi:hypothetical protein
MSREAEAIMVRTQIDLTDQERKHLGLMARRTGQTQSELIRAAIDRFVQRAQGDDRLAWLREGRGLWKGRKDLPDVAGFRRELDRTSSGANA